MTTHAASSRRRRPSALVGLLAGVVLLAVNAASAQSAPPAGTIKLTVHDSLGYPVAGADLNVAGTVLHGESDVDGVVSLTSVAYGPATLRVRRLGFRPLSLDVVVEPGTTRAIDVVLARAAQPLAPVLVRGGRRVYSGRLASFFERRDLGNGHFFTRDELERMNPTMMTDVMRRVPGVRIVNTRLVRNAIRFRNNACAPLVWLDGSPLGAGEFDLDALSPRSVDAMEIYSGVSTIPVQFSEARGLSNCGVIAVWSRTGELRRKQKKGQSPAASLADAVASLSVFTADQVDVPAHTDSSLIVRPNYPDAMFTAGISGSVIAEFVVDSTGEVDIDDFNVLSSSDPLFTESVRQALRYAQFYPAVRQGRPVRQVVQLPFHFVYNPSAGARRE